MGFLEAGLVEDPLGGMVAVISGRSGEVGEGTD